MHTWNRRRLLITGTILLAAALMVYGLSLLFRENEAFENSAGAEAEFGTEFASARIVGRYKGQKQWMLEAAAMRDNGDTVVLEGIDKGIIYREDKEFVTFSAGRGLWEKKQRGLDSNDLLLEDNVVIYMDGLPVLRTSRLQWDADANVLDAPSEVFFEREGSRIYAEQMVMDARKQEVTLKGNIRLDMDDGSLMTVVGRLTYNLETGEFEASGPVTVERGG